ncbi:MAG: hypothetical protein R3F13_10730 [Prosthecobacter sp.]
MTEPSPSSCALPFTDTKPVGHADFYFAVNATFRFILNRFGIEKLKDYWRDIGANYYRPVTKQWMSGGLPAVADYWRTFFKAEPGAEVDVQEMTNEVRVEVKVCPLIQHLRKHGREVVPCFCQHCYFVSETIAAPAGLTVRVDGGNGRCVQRFVKVDAGVPAQNLEDIATAL